MKKVYSQIWNLAKPHYKKGRPMDIDHIQWMMKDAALVCKKEKLDDSLLLPLVILHDVGYAEVPKDNPFKLNLRKAHMKAGAKIARRILEQVKYPADKINKLEYYRRYFIFFNRNVLPAFEFDQLPANPLPLPKNQSAVKIAV